MPPGTPDFLFVYCEKPCAIEAKASTDLSDDQKRVIPEMREDGWVVGVSFSLSEVKDFLDAVRDGIA